MVESSRERSRVVDPSRVMVEYRAMEEYSEVESSGAMVE